ncbi:DEAD/DEAH box helicase, partial [Sphingobacterium sp.]
MAIPVILERRDCIAIAPTGTGKTEAFAIPIVQLLLEKEIQYNASVLILLPTRELCIQTKQRITNLLIGLDLGIASFYGGETYESQLEMYQHAQIILATPGRLVDFIEQEV